MKNQIYRWLTATMLCVVTFFCVGTSAFARSEPVLTETSVREGGLIVYAYRPFSNDGKNAFLNEIFCEQRIFPVTADNKQGFHLTDTAKLLDDTWFTTELRKTFHPDYASSLRQVEPRSGTGYPGICLTLEKNPVVERFLVGVNITYRAKQDTTLPCVDADGQKTVLHVGKGAAISYNATVTVDYDQLKRLVVKPVYATSRYSLNSLGAAGVTGETLFPDRKKASDITWSSAADIIAARLDFDTGKLSAYPKLYTSKREVNLGALAKGRKFYVRKFSPVAITGNVSLYLENPFLTFDGQELVPTKEVFLYELRENKLYLLNDQISIVKNTSKRNCFRLTTDHLGTYIITDKAF